MRTKTRQTICLFLLFLFTTPSHGITFISGIKPIENGKSNYWWLENSSQCQIKLAAWLSSGNYSDILGDNLITFNKTILNKKERAMMLIKENKEGYFNAWINIIQIDSCGVTKLTRIKW